VEQKMRKYKLTVNHFAHGVIEVIAEMNIALHTLEQSFVLNAFYAAINDHIVFSVSDILLYEVV
jgi:hypothetical protein